MASPILLQSRITRIWNTVSPILQQPSRGTAHIVGSKSTCFEPLIHLSRHYRHDHRMMPMISMNSSEFSCIFNVPMFFKATSTTSIIKQRAPISETDTILNYGSPSTSSSSVDDHNREETKMGMKCGLGVKALSLQILEKINIVGGGAGLVRLVVCCLLLQCLALSGGGGGGGFIKLPHALAYSGGVMGGGSFSSRSSSRSSSYRGRSSYRRGRTSSSSDGISAYEMIIWFCFWAWVMYVLNKDVDETPGKTSVLKLQVGLSGTARSLQKELTRIGVTADTSHEKGLNCILTETVQALLQHPDYCMLGYSSVDVELSIYLGEHCFNQLSRTERKKFKEETLVNLNGKRKQSASSQRADGSMNEYIVITILVAVTGEYQLPTIRSSGDLKAALTKLSSIPSNRTQAVQVLWAPQDENDSLSLEELRKDYSELQPLLAEYSAIPGEEITPTSTVHT